MADAPQPDARWSSSPPSEEKFWNSPPTYVASVPPTATIPPRPEPSTRRRGVVSLAFRISVGIVIALLGYETVRYVQARHAEPTARDTNPVDRPY